MISMQLYEVSHRMLLYVAIYVNAVYYCILYHKQVQCQPVNATFTRIRDVLSKWHVTHVTEVSVFW